MTNTLFPQSEVADPYALYARMLAGDPVHWDAHNKLWAVYSHAGCRHVLAASTAAHIPTPNAAHGLSGIANKVIGNLARLANPPAHAEFRHAVMRLFDAMQSGSTAALLTRLLDAASMEIDWVDAVCKKLPALAVLTGFAFTEEDIGFLLPRVARLTQLMLPNKSAQQVADVNAVTAEVMPVVERHLRRIAALSALMDENNLAIYAANLIGLLIQSHDAGRGLLGNALLQALAHPGNGKQYWEQLVVETLRFDPAIQNTRRVLAEDLHVDGKLLRAGETVLVVLAAANRDPSVFAHPAQFDVERGNNGDHLTFGAGMHQCAANHFSVALAADALSALFDDGARRIALLQPGIAYEPLVNARLPKQILLRLHRSS